MDAGIQDRLRGIMIGATCAKVEHHEPSSWFQLTFDGAQWLTIESTWRLVQRGKIVVGCRSPAKIWDRLPERLVGRTIQSIELHSELHDLSVTFDAGFVLETFVDSESYENWTAGEKSATWRSIICGVGGEFSVFWDPESDRVTD